MTTAPSWQNRTKTFTSEERASITEGSFFSPLLNLLHMERTHVSDGRRKHFRETPPWFLFFKNSYYENAREYIHQTLCTMGALDMPIPSFHTETGVLTKHLVEYLRSVDDADKIMTFVSSFRSYIFGEKKRMPRNISLDKKAYDSLKTLVGTEYTKRLIGEYKAGSGVLKTQDFIVLFKMPLFALLETVFCSITDEDIVQAIEEYRQ